MKKLKSRRGETIIEGLVSILIVALCFGFLTTAVVTAERITSKTKAQDVAFHYYKDQPDEKQTGTVTVTYKDTLTTTSAATVTVYHVKNSATDEGYWYYEK